AEAACNALTEALHSHAGLAEATMHAAVGAAWLAVRALPYTRTDNSDPPSTTLVAAVVCEGRATIGWGGDSPAYWITGEGGRQLRHAHSGRRGAVAAGRRSVEEARRSQQAHALTRWLGTDADADTAAATVVQEALSGAGLLLLCTDGLWNYVPESVQLAALVQ